MTMAPRVEAHLEKVGVSYELIKHPLSHNSHQSARAAHLPAEKLAKAIITHDGDRYCMCVIPANHRLLLSALDQHMHGHFRLASEEELQWLFDDCAQGAIPALGQVYGMHVIWDECFENMDDIYFEGGDHQHLVHLSRAAFMELMGRQEHRPISRPEDDLKDAQLH